MSESTASIKKVDPQVGRFFARGDYICVLMFAVVGLLTHGEAISFWGVVRNALPILVVWWLIAPFMRTYTYPSYRNLFYTWLIAVTLGVWLRFMVLDKPFGIGFLIFLLVTLGFTFLFLLAWRLLANFWLGRRLRQVS